METRKGLRERYMEEWRAPIFNELDARGGNASRWRWVEQMLNLLKLPLAIGGLLLISPT